MLPSGISRAMGVIVKLSPDSASLIVKKKWEFAKGEPSPGSRDAASHLAGLASHSWIPGSESYK